MNIFEQVKEIPIEDVIKKYLPSIEFKTSGRWQVAKCPFHKETDPSFGINENTNSWHCFGCGKGGSTIDLVMDALGIEALEAAKELARAWNIPFQEFTPEERAKHQEAETRQQLLEKYIAWTQGQLGDEQRKALHKRGLNDEAIEEYRIGFDPGQAGYRPDENRRKSYEALGFIGSSGGYLPGGRVVIPVLQYGRPVYVISWDYRHTEDSQMPKYLYPSGWSKPLVGLDLIRRDKPLYLVEGIFDWLSMRQAGYLAVCTLGTSVKQEHQARLKKASEVYIFFDNDGEKVDNPGQKAALKLLRGMYPKARNILLPKEKDPNDCYVDDPEGFIELIDRLTGRAKDAAEILLDKLEAMSPEEIKTPASEGRIKYFLSEIIPLMARLDDEIARDMLINRIHSKLKPAGITKKSLQSEVRKAAGEQDAETEEEKETQQDILLRLAESAFLFKNEFREPFARIGVDDHQETWKCTSRDFKLWLTGKYYDETGKGPNSEALSAALNTISAKAWRSKEEFRLYTRVAELDGVFWYDLADDQWRAVKITPGGWEVVNNPPVLFRRYGHQQAQPEPRRGGNVFKLLDFVNLKDENAKILFLVSIVTSFIPDIPHIVFVIFGPEGSGKSTISKITRIIIDPSGSLTCKCYSDHREFVQYLAHNYVTILENLSGISPVLSDMICSAVTGDGDSKRQLYTDDEDIIYNYKRVFIINGVNNVVTRPDLLRRSVLFQTEKWLDSEALPEKELWRLFEAARPDILGGIFDTLSKAMELYPQLELSGLYDMADYTRWGCAIAEALGYGADAFLAAYTENRGQQAKEAIANHPVASAVSAFMHGRNEWSGQPSELLDELERVAMAEKINTKLKAWPKAANSLTRRLNEAKTVLAKSGIRIEAGKSGEREIVLTREGSENTVQTVQTVQTVGGQGFQAGRYVDDTGRYCNEKINTVQIPPSPKPLRDKRLDDMDDMDDIFPTLQGDDDFLSSELWEGEI